MKSQHTYSSLDELRQIRLLARRSQSVDELREYFDRVQTLRRTHLDDFDLQVLIAEIHEEIVERARDLREEGSAPAPELREHAPLPPGPKPLDQKTWRRATFIGLFFTLVILAAFFYLIQAARKSNLLMQQTPAAALASPAGKLQPVSAGSAPQPILRLYTDLVPGTVSIDDGSPKDLKDGELVLDHLAPGRHTIHVGGNSGSAEFTYDVSGNAAPQIVGAPSAANAMAVLVVTENGKAHLVTSAQNSNVLLDGTAEGRPGPGGITIAGVTQADHELDVADGKDRQRFILTYTASPALTVYVKSDPNAGTLVLVTHQDGAEVFLNGRLYGRRTSRGQLRIPLKVGQYMVRVHKAGFIDPPAETVQVEKAEETALQFSLQPQPRFAMLAIHGALPGTMVYLDRHLAAVTGIDGSAQLSNVEPGEHAIELRRGQQIPKQFARTFHPGDVITLSGPTVLLTESAVTEPAALPRPSSSAANTVAPNYNVEIKGEQVYHGGGFVAYKVPQAAGTYSFLAQPRKSGFLRHARVQWYAAYRDSRNYVVFTLDGKRAIAREVRDGQSFEVARIPFSLHGNGWVQVHMQVKRNRVITEVKTSETGWVDLGGPFAGPDQDFTKGKVGFYIPGKDEIAVSDFHFSNK